MGQQGISLPHEGKFATWRVNLDSYFLSMNEYILLSVEYGITDKSNDLDKRLF